MLIKRENHNSESSKGKPQPKNIFRSILTAKWKHSVALNKEFSNRYNPKAEGELGHYSAKGEKSVKTPILQRT